MSDAPDTQGSTRLAALIRGLVARPWRALALLTVASVLAGWWGAGIPIKGDMEALFPEDTPTIVRAQRAREIVGSRSELTILVGSPDRALNRRVSRRLAEGLSAQTDVFGSVEYERDISFFEDNALLYLPVEELRELDEQVAEVIREAVRKDMALDDLDDEPAEGEGDKARPKLPSDEAIRARYSGASLGRFFETPDGEVIAVKAYPRFKPQNIPKTTAMMADIEALLAAAKASEGGEAAIQTTVIGDYSGVSKSVDQITHSLGRSSAVALVLIMLVLALYFRRARAIALVLLPLVVGIVWTVSYARLFIGQLNLISAFIFAILLGLGIDFAVHAGSRVDEARRSGLPLPEALATALPQMGRAMTMAAMTTIATFLSLTIFDFRGFSQFGWIAAAGVALSLTAVYLVLPPLSVVLQREQAAPASPARAARPMPPERARRLAWGTICAIVLATGVAAVALPDLTFDGDMRKLRMKTPAKTNALRFKYFSEADSRPPSPALIITDDLAETERVHRHLERKAGEMERLSGVSSIFSFVADQQADKLAIVAEMKRRVDQKYGLLEGQDRADADRLRKHLSPRAFEVDDLPDWVQAKFTDTTGSVGRYVLLYPVGVKSQAEEVLAIQEAIGAVEVDGKTYHSTAAWMFTGDAYLTVRREGPLAVGLAALVVFLLLLFDLRRPVRAVLSFLPLAMGFVLFLGVMAWAEIPLNLFNVVVLPTIFGIGVDTAIHLEHRLREGHGVGHVLRTTGTAALVSALTTAIGFASLLVVDSEGLRSIGWVAVIGIACTSVCTTALIAAFATLRSTKTALGT